MLGLRPLVVLVLSFILVLSPVVAQQTATAIQRAQQATTMIQRDSQSVALLNTVVSAMGGASALSGTGIVAHGQTTVPPAGISGPILWENQGPEFRYERPGPNGPIIFVSGHGNPALSDGVKVRRNIGHLALTTLPPHLAAVAIASSLANQKAQISSATQTTLDSSTVIKISTVDTTDELTSVVCKQEWYFDSSTLLPVRVDFLASEASNALATIKMTYLFSNYQKVSGIAIPFSVRTLADGQQIEQVTFTSVVIGGTIASTDFDAPVVTGAAQ